MQMKKVKMINIFLRFWENKNRCVKEDYGSQKARKDNEGNGFEQIGR